MSNQLTIQDRIYSVESDFNKVNAYKLNFIKEAGFALQLLENNSFLYDCANKNPVALEYALINIASIGISLNPALKECYLVPRGGKICLDISYIGLTKLATDSGSIRWVQAQVVKEKDTFVFNGVGIAPTHTMDPFAERGSVVGVYCVAKTSNNEYLTTMMSKAECLAIRDKSSQTAKNGPWKDFEEEMIKKTVIKRASKLWPKSDRLSNAVDVLNEHEGVDFGKEKTAFANQPSINALAVNAVQKIKDTLALKDFTEERLIIYINKRFKRDPSVVSIDDFSPEEIEESFRILGA